MRTEGMLGKARELLKKEDARDFSISTRIPKDWLVREECVWDIGMKDAESIKNKLNRMISSSLKGKYVPDGEVRIVFDYSDKSVKLERNDLFVFGRYKKLVPGLSQSRWRCQKCKGEGCKECEGKGKYYESVEERIGEPLKAATDADDYVLHASGREDVDATNSAGRIFVLMLKNPKHRRPDLAEAASKIAESKEVEVGGLRFVKRGFVELVTESHFDKTYRATVALGKEIGEKEIKEIKALEGKAILQKTPKRVVHRRANLVRHRRIKRIDVEKEGKGLVLTIKAEAGTYIKELISGDDGRTEPSIAGIVGVKAECTALDVSEIDDSFIDSSDSGKKQLDPIFLHVLEISLICLVADVSLAVYLIGLQVFEYVPDVLYRMHRDICLIAEFLERAAPYPPLHPVHCYDYADDVRLQGALQFLHRLDFCPTGGHDIIHQDHPGPQVELAADKGSPVAMELLLFPVKDPFPVDAMLFLKGYACGHCERDAFVCRAVDRVEIFSERLLYPLGIVSAELIGEHAVGKHSRAYEVR